MDIGLILVTVFWTFAILTYIMEGDGKASLIAHIIVFIAGILLLLFLAWFFYELFIVG